MKVSIRKANPDVLLEQQCSHVCEIAVEDERTQVFVGSSAEGALLQALDHIHFCSTAYAYVLLPEEPANEAKAAQLKREMTAAGLVFPKPEVEEETPPMPPDNPEPPAEGSRTEEPEGGPPDA